jgi:DNA-binding NarL/FixJ family response regulator
MSGDASGSDEKRRTMMNKIRVMLVDDHAVVRVGFRMLINASKDMEVVDEAESGEVATSAYAEKCDPTSS